MGLRHGQNGTRVYARSERVRCIHRARIRGRTRAPGSAAGATRPIGAERRPAVAALYATSRRPLPPRVPAGRVPARCRRRPGPRPSIRPERGGDTPTRRRGLEPARPRCTGAADRPAPPRRIQSVRPELRHQPRHDCVRPRRPGAARRRPARPVWHSRVAGARCAISWPAIAWPYAAFVVRLDRVRHGQRARAAVQGN